jgi:hypothetical protein
VFIHMSAEPRRGEFPAGGVDEFLIRPEIRPRVIAEVAHRQGEDNELPLGRRREVWVARGIADGLGAGDVEHLELELAVSHC